MIATELLKYNRVLKAPPTTGVYTLTNVNFSLFLDINKYGVDPVCSVPGQLKNIVEKILSQESMR
jgi:hypothetical protein